MLDEDGDEGDGEETVSPKVVGHNIYILCHQLALYNREIGALLKPSVETMDAKMAEALRFYNSHTAQGRRSRFNDIVKKWDTNTHNVSGIRMAE